MPTYRVHVHEATTRLLEHPAPNIAPGDVIVLSDGREALVTARVEAEPGPLAPLLEVVVAPLPTKEESAASRPPRC